VPPGTASIDKPNPKENIMSQNLPTLTPHLAIRNASEALDFYQKAFGAELVGVHKIPDGRVMHSALSFGGPMVYVVDEFPEHGGKSPEALGGTPVTIHLQVADCDKVFQRAVDAGCTAIMPLQEMFWGDKYGLLKDPYGHQWSVATTVRQVSPEELDKVAASMAEGNCGPGEG
jgi:PhnB protein